MKRARDLQFYYLAFVVHSQRCEHDWLKKFGNQALDHFGRLHEPKRTDASGAWYKDYVIGEVIIVIDNHYITLLMIYLVNADQLQQHNTMMKALLVHNKWSTR